MAALKGHRTIKTPFANEIEWYRIRYSFALDAGAQGVLDIATASGKLIVVRAHLRVVTAGAGATATLKWGVTGNDNRFLNVTQGAVASLTAEACLFPLAVEGTPNVLPVPVVLASGDKILQTISTADLTAGVFEYCIGVMKV